MSPSVHPPTFAAPLSPATDKSDVIEEVLPYDYSMRATICASVYPSCLDYLANYLISPLGTYSPETDQSILSPPHEAYPDIGMEPIQMAEMTGHLPMKADPMLLGTQNFELPPMGMEDPVQYEPFNLDLTAGMKHFGQDWLLWKLCAFFVIIMQFGPLWSPLWQDVHPHLCMLCFPVLGFFLYKFSNFTPPLPPAADAMYNLSDPTLPPIHTSDPFGGFFTKPFPLLVIYKHPAENYICGNSRALDTICRLASSPLTRPSRCSQVPRTWRLPRHRTLATLIVTPT